MSCLGFSAKPPSQERAGSSSATPTASALLSDVGFRVSGFGFGVSGVGLRVAGFEFRVSGFGFWVSGLGFCLALLGVHAIVSLVWGSGFRVQDVECARAGPSSATPTASLLLSGSELWV